MTIDPAWGRVTIRCDGGTVARGSERVAARGGHPPRRPAAGAGRSGQRQDPRDHAPHRVAGRAGHPARERPCTDLLHEGGRGDALARRGAAREPVRGARLHDLPRLLRAGAAGGGGGGRLRPVLPSGDAGRPARPDDGAPRQPRCAPPRHAREPGAVPGEADRADRPPQGRDGACGRVPRLGGVARVERGRGGARLAARARPSSRACTRTTTACSTRPGRWTSAR